MCLYYLQDYYYYFFIQAAGLAQCLGCVPQEASLLADSPGSNSTCRTLGGLVPVRCTGSVVRMKNYFEHVTKMVK